MMRDRTLSLLWNRYVVGLLLAATCVGASAAEFTGRGIFHFASNSGCPFAALANATAECNRIALDDGDTRATVDVAARKIQFRNTRNYAAKTIVGDVLLQGSGLSKDGRRVPLSFHLVLSKSGDKWLVSSHAHAPVKGEFTDVQIDPYQVAVNGAEGDRGVLAPQEITAMLTHPALATRLVSEIVQVRDTRLKGEKDADITIALGIGKAAIPVMRAQLRSDAVDGSNFGTALKQGTWAVELEALSGHIPEHVAQRELFLYGIDEQVLLKPILERGFKAHEKLVVGAINGKGYLRLGEQQMDFPGAEAAAREFMQQSFIGLILGWYQSKAGASGG